MNREDCIKVYSKFKENCIVIDLDGGTQVITEDKLLEILTELENN